MTRFSLLAVMAGVGALIAGCATPSESDTAGGAASAPASSSASAPAQAPERQPDGMRYEQLRNMFNAGNSARVKQELVGQRVTLELIKPRGRDAPAGSYSVEGPDRTYFQCQAADPGFAGGRVTTSVVDYRYVAQTRQRILDLANCVDAAPAASTAAAPAPAPAAAPAPAPKAAPAASPAPAPSSAGKPGMDARGNVIDSSKVEAGSGRTVKGLNDYEGEITGNPAANSKFTRLQIGMSARQVTDLVGPPTDQGAYITGKAWIPFYFGADRHRFEMTYKGQGRLIFAGGGMGDFSNGYLIWIIHNPNESGYR